VTKRFGPLIALTLAELTSFGLFAGRVGFYHDDWANLERCFRAGGVFSGMRVYAGIVPDRPVEILQYPLLFAIGGFNPLPYQLAYLALDVAAGFLLYRLLDALLGDRDFALLAAVLVLLFPNHAITHIWLGSSALLVSLVLVFASLLLHLRWMSRKGVWLLVASQGLYIAGLLDYEATAFLPLIAWAGLRFGSRPKATVSFVPYLASFAAVMCWQRLVVPHLFGAGEVRAAGLSVSHFFAAYAAGLAAITVDVARMCGKGVIYFGAWPVIAAVCLSAAGASALKRPGHVSWKPALAMAAAAFLAGYLPFAVSSDYMPISSGIMARTCALGAIAGGILLALAIFSAPRAYRAPLVAVSLAAFTLANWRAGSQWARSWSLQQEILSKAAPLVKGLPPSSTVLVAGFFRFIDDEEGTGALVFDRDWDIGSALRLKSGRVDLAANVVSARMVFHRREAVESFQGKILRRYPYGSLYVYGHDRGTLFHLRSGKDAPRFIIVGRISRE
jgi:hypothetical protein